MWSLALFLHVVFKWLAYHLSEVNLAEPANRGALRTWFYCWPGMDPLPFLDRADRDVSRVPARKWTRAFATISAGLFSFTLQRGRCLQTRSWRSVGLEWLVFY